MSRKTRTAVGVALVSLALTLSSCGQNFDVQPVSSPPPQTSLPTNIVEFAPNVKEVSQADKAVINDITEHQITFSKPVLYQAGDTIVSATLPQIMRKVISTTTINGITILQTEPANLSDIIKNGHISQEVQLFSITQPQDSSIDSLSTVGDNIGEIFNSSDILDVMCPQRDRGVGAKPLLPIEMPKGIQNYCVSGHPKFIFDFDASKATGKIGIGGDMQASFKWSLLEFKAEPLYFELPTPIAPYIKAVNKAGKALAIPVQVHFGLVVGPKTWELTDPNKMPSPIKQFDPLPEKEIKHIFLEVGNKLSGDAYYQIGKGEPNSSGIITDKDLPGFHNSIKSEPFLKFGTSNTNIEINELKSKYSAQMDFKAGLETSLTVGENSKAYIFAGGKLDVPVALNLSPFRVDYEPDLSYGYEGGITAALKGKFLGGLIDFNIKLIDEKLEPKYNSLFRKCGSMPMSASSVSLSIKPDDNQVINQFVNANAIIEGYPYSWDNCKRPLLWTWSSGLKDTSLSNSPETQKDFQAIGLGNQTINVSFENNIGKGDTKSLNIFYADALLIPQQSKVAVDDELQLEAQGLGTTNEFTWSVYKLDPISKQRLTGITTDGKIQSPAFNAAKVQFSKPGFYEVEVVNTKLPQLVATSRVDVGYRVTPIVNGPGFVTPSAPVITDPGITTSTVSFKATAQAGAKFNGVSPSDCVGQLVDDTYTTGLLTKNCTVTFNFERVASTNPAVLEPTSLRVSPSSSVKVDQSTTFNVDIKNTGDTAFGGWLAIGLTKVGESTVTLFESQNLTATGKLISPNQSAQTFTFTKDMPVLPGDYVARLYYAATAPANLNDLSSAGWMPLASTADVTVQAPDVTVAIAAPITVAPVNTPLTYTATVTGSPRNSVTWKASSPDVTISNPKSNTIQVSSKVPGEYTLTATSDINPQQSATSAFTVGQVQLTSTGPAPTPVVVKQGQEAIVQTTVTNTGKIPFQGMIAVAIDANQNGTYWAPLQVARFNTAEYPTLAPGVTSSTVTFKKTISSAKGTYKLKLFYAETLDADVTNLATSAWKPLTPEGTMEVQYPDLNISVSPQVETVPVNTPRNFTATITGNDNTGVTWTVSPSTGVTITPDNKASTISVQASAPGEYVLTATSTANPERQATARLVVGASNLQMVDPNPVLSSPQVQLGSSLTVSANVINNGNIPFTGWVTAAIKWTNDTVDANGNKVPGAWQTLGVQRFGSSTVPALQQGQSAPLTFTGLAGVAGGTYDVQLFYAEQQPGDEGNANSANWKPLGNPKSVVVNDPEAALIGRYNIDARNNCTTVNFPNPLAGIYNISASGTMNYNINVYGSTVDASGAPVNQMGDGTPLNLSGYPVGYFYLKLPTGNVPIGISKAVELPGITSVDLCINDIVNSYDDNSGGYNVTISKGN